MADKPDTLKDRMDAIYRDLELDEIPWNFEEPPGVLLELVESGRIRPCDVVDLGCGAGSHLMWLASLGFRVTGIDLSAEAIDVAGKRARARGLSCRFLAADLASEDPDLEGQFDLAYDWKVLHHVFPEQRPRWAESVHHLLRPEGTYVSVCFSESEPTGFPGDGKYRDTPLGTKLYLSSEEEIRELFEERFEIEELETIVVPGRSAPHTAVKAIMKRLPDLPFGSG